MSHENNRRKLFNYSYLKPLLMLVLLSSFDTSAADWASIKKTKNYELLVDMDSYNESAGLPFITAKTIFNSPKSYALNGKKLSYIEELSTSQFDCKLHTYKVLETHFYKQKNKLAGSQKSVSPFILLEKNSDSASIASLVCQVHQMVGGQ